MKFHITITDNETGEVIRDQDTCAIIGAIDAAEKGTGSICLTACNIVELGATATGALQAARHAISGLPDDLKRFIEAKGTEID